MMKKLKSYSRAKDKNKTSIAYFTQIEFGESDGEFKPSKGYSFNPHIHIQFFYDDFAPIEKTLLFLKENCIYKNSDVTHPKCNKLTKYEYVIKEYYRPYDEEYEIRKKERLMGKPMYTASRKELPNYVIKYIYRYLNIHLKYIWKTFKNEENYLYILKQIDKKNIIIEEKDSTLSDDYIVVNNKSIMIDIESMLYE
ncbi:hypothetical protein CBGD1_2013 [Sulfurimonas gotlandica GD1]|nr:hypothetical protein CBGD1_2013 [Sulfurimonas gotlandica GD1]